MIEFRNVLPRWQQELVDKYPLIYKEPNPCLRHWYPDEKFDDLINDPNFTNLRYGFEFGIGWANLIDDFSKTAQDLVIHLRATVQPDAYIYACIFKEKFRRLTWQGDDNLIEPFKKLFRCYTYRIEDKSIYTNEHTGEYRSTL